MSFKLINTLNEVLKILALNKHLVVKDKNLLSLQNNEINTPIGDILPLLLKHTSTLKDQFVDLQSIEKLIVELTKNNSVIRLNHVGFCYKVESQQLEKKRLLHAIKNSQSKLYIEPSDNDAWYFIGNADNWQAMMIELVTIQSTDDIWKDYWLPHVQIDIDTNLSEKEIINLITLFFGNKINPFSIVIDGVTYIVRNRLGTIDGVNITIDLATNSRNVQYQRQNLLKRIDI